MDLSPRRRGMHAMFFLKSAVKEPVLLDLRIFLVLFYFLKNRFLFNHVYKKEKVRYVWFVAWWCPQANLGGKKSR